MADDKKSQQLAQNLKMREIMSDAYTFVRSRQYVQTVANLTYEELLDAAVGRIEGKSDKGEVRATRLERVMKLRDQIGSAVDTVKSKPPESWVIEGDGKVEDKDAANTPE